MAKTPEDTFEDLNSLSSDPPRIPVLVKNIENINAETVIEHGLNTLRMIPGSFFVVGIFVVSTKSVFDDASDMQKLKTIINQMAE